MFAGCRYERVTPEPKPIDPALDLCPMRLQDIGGAILLYHLSHGKMPADLAAIRQAGGKTCPPIECPVSHEPYIYHPEGIDVAGLPGRVVLYDSTPCHNGRIWALVASLGATGNTPQVQPFLLPPGAIPPTTAPAEGSGKP